MTLIIDKFSKKENMTIQKNFTGNYQSVMESARNAQKIFAQTTIEEKIKIIKRFRTFILKHHDEIVTRVQAETKKSKTDAFLGEIYGVLDHLNFLEKNAKKTLKDKKIATPISMLGKKSRLFFDPLGVILIISPWNYPFYQAIVPITSALITGNSVIYKPSEFTPLYGLIEKACEFALKNYSDTVKIIYGTGDVGKELINQKPNKIFFTGSVATGKKIMAQASQFLIPVELELGGKDPMIIFEDANILRASKGAIWGSMTNCGQSCTSTERLFIHKNIFSEVKNNLIKEAMALTQGIDSDGSTDVGYMTTQTQVEIVRSHLEDAMAKGAVQLTGQHWDKKSTNIPLIILENLNPTMTVYSEETFGPILPIIKFETEEEAIKLANNSKYGLSASIWTEDKTRGQKIAHKLEVGGVSINNVMLTEGNHALPFGGVKESGIGRYKGQEGLYSFTNIKSILIDGGHNNIDPNWYPYTPEKYNLFREMTLGLFGGGIANFIKFAINGLKLEGLSNKLGKKTINKN